LRSGETDRPSQTNGESKGEKGPPRRIQGESKERIQESKERIQESKERIQESKERIQGVQRHPRGSQGVDQRHSTHTPGRAREGERIAFNQLRDSTNKSTEKSGE